MVPNSGPSRGGAVGRYPPNCDIHRRDLQWQVYLDSRRRSNVSNAQKPVIARGCAEWVNRPVTAFPVGIRTEGMDT